jgi:hypothetical protein
MKNGIYYDLPAEDYFAAEHINNSSLKLINKSPLHYKSSLEIKRDETKALVIGSAVHCSVLERESFFDRYAVAPKIDKRTKEGKERFTELESSGKIILGADDFEQISAITNAVLFHDTASKILAEGRAEVSVFTEVLDVQAKCRIDWHRPGILTDLKTTDDASPSGFARSVANYGYAMQAAWYLDCCEAAGLDARTFIFIAVEKSPPYAVAIYELTPESIEVGRIQYQRALALYKHCMATGEWPGYDTSIIQLSLPQWAINQEAA